MPYCRKCGAKLADDARFCYVCGTPVTPIVAGAPPTTPLRQPVRRAAFPVATITLIAVLVFAVAVAAVVLLPLQPVEFNQQNQASAANVDRLNMTVNADVANVYVIFRNLPENQRAIVNVSATGSKGLFTSDQIVALAFEEKTEDSTLSYTATVSRTQEWFVSQQISCYVYIDPSAIVSLAVKTGTGQITFETTDKVTIENLSLETDTGSIGATLTQNVLVAGTFSLRAVTDSVHLAWNGADVSGNAPVTLRSSTGSVDVSIIQSGHNLYGNVTINAETTTGGIDFALDINGGVGAKIESANTALGGINVHQRGFSANEVPLQSTNYPGSGNFLVNLRTSTGGITINANYESGVSN